jgi:hypothetical protein
MDEPRNGVVSVRKWKAATIVEEFDWAPWAAGHLSQVCGMEGVCCFVWTCGAYTPKHEPQIPGVAAGLIRFAWGREYCHSLFPLQMESINSKTGLRTLSTKPIAKVAAATGMRVDQIVLIDDSRDRMHFNPPFSMLLTPTYRPGVLTKEVGVLQVTLHFFCAHVINCP